MLPQNLVIDAGNLVIIQINAGLDQSPVIFVVNSVTLNLSACRTKRQENNIRVRHGFQRLVLLVRLQSLVHILLHPISKPSKKRKKVTNITSSHYHLFLNRLYIPQSLWMVNYYGWKLILVLLFPSSQKNLLREVFTKPLQSSPVKLKTYTGESLPVFGSINVEVKYDKRKMSLSLLVAGLDGPSLLGRDWLSDLRLDWYSILKIQTNSLDHLLQKYSDVFEEGLGTLKNFKAKLYVAKDVKPRFIKARSVPYAIRSLVDTEIDHLIAQNVIEPIVFSDWAAPIVPVFTLSGGKVFTKLDLRQAYQQLALDEDSKKYVVINTHRGLFRYNRLPFRVSSASGIFQRAMENLLKDIPRVVVYLDDILLTGSSEVQHLETLQSVLQRLESAGLKLKRDKCKFLTSSITYLGHRIDSEGLHPLQDKIKAILNAPSPTSVTELKSFLGLLSYYGKFIPNLASTLHPLYELLKKSVKWLWNDEEENVLMLPNNYYYLTMF